jgi:hypothetical protein
LFELGAALRYVNEVLSQKASQLAKLTTDAISEEY